MNELSPRVAVFARFVEGFLEPLQPAFADQDVSEILINGSAEIFLERQGRLERSALRFQSESELLSALRAVAQFLGRAFDEEHPILEGRLPDGSRLQAVMGSLAQGGTCVAIRRHKVDSLNWKRLIELGALDQNALSLLKALVQGRENIIVSGGTGTGKTSVLRCLASLISEDERVVTLEDARELMLSHPHVVSLESRPADAKGRGEVNIAHLFHASLRMRPDRIVIGEIRGQEAFDLIQAMTSGHGGCLSSVHASSALDALRRVETMALYRGLDLPLAALRAQVASAVGVIVQVQRLADGRRQVESITQVEPLSAAGDYQLRVLLHRGSADGPLQPPPPAKPALSRRAGGHHG